jgi:hypothetical protein
MKSNYIAIITAELQKLSEDQLYKVLVLVKNTTDEQKVPEPKRFPNNKALFTDVGLAVELNYLEKSESVAIRKMIADAGLTGGYGIISMAAPSTVTKDLASFICFCIPDKIDMMIEVCQVRQDSLRTGHFIYVLTVKDVSNDKVEERNVIRFHNRKDLTTALENVVKTYAE